MDCLHREANGAVIAGWPTHTMSFPCGEKERSRFLKGGRSDEKKYLGKDQMRKSSKMNLRGKM